MILMLFSRVFIYDEVWVWWRNFYAQMNITWCAMQGQDFNGGPRPNHKTRKWSTSLQRLRTADVTDTISWWGHHDRVMQLNSLYFCGICQMMPLKMWPKLSSRLQPSINLHAPVTAYLFSCSGTQCTTPEGWRFGKALCSDPSHIVYWAWPPIRIQTLSAGFEPGRLDSKL